MIDINNLPFPKVIQTITFEDALRIRKELFLSFYEGEEKELWTKRLELESEPVLKDLQQDAYFDVLERTRLNDTAKALMLPYSKGSDLDNLVVLFGVQRLVVQEADNSVTPNIPEILESDERLLQRQQLKLRSISTAGPIDSYKYHALTASADVLDVSIDRPAPGTVEVIILSTDRGNEATQSLLDSVKQALNDEDIRPLNDTVQVISSEIVNFNITAKIQTYDSVLKDVVIQNAKDELNRSLSELYKLGHDITLSEINRALKQQGVKNVTIQQPTQDIVITQNQVGFCERIDITASEVEEY